MIEFLCGMAVFIGLNGGVCGESIDARVVKVIDGDTIMVQAIGANRVEKVRMLGIDAPEIHGHCAEESLKARQAADYLRRAIPPSTIVRLTSSPEGWRRDRYQRVLAKVARSETDLGQALVSSGLAVAWRPPAPRPQWCR